MINLIGFSAMCFILGYIIAKKKFETIDTYDKSNERSAAFCSLCAACNNCKDKYTIEDSTNCENFK